ncbi:MAG: hypothetical protein IKJ08_03770 [Alistipes sp.]|nr:hypothetical protein [Alistipes sp.]
MRRFLLLILLFASCTFNVYAQHERRYTQGVIEETRIYKTIEPITPYSLGLRVSNSCVSGTVEYKYNEISYWEGRIGYNYFREGLVLAGLHNWRLLQYNNIFLDLGCGLVICTECYIAAKATARAGFTLRKIPLSISLDLAPNLIYDICYGYIGIIGDSGISFTYNF